MLYFQVSSMIPDYYDEDIDKIETSTKTPADNNKIETSTKTLFDNATKDRKAPDTSNIKSTTATTITTTTQLL